MNYILFDRSKEEEGKTWTLESVTEFCNNQNLTFTIIDRPECFVAEIEKPQDDTEYKLVEITETVSMIFKADPELEELFTGMEKLEKIEEVDEGLQKLEIVT